jgi:DNA-binding transcriptional ArsR family regulator
MSEPRFDELTDEELKALAHPLRVRMLEALADDGPATASGLAERFGESSGATSYHLRQLARHGFIEEDEQRRGGRQRWWRILRRGWSIPSYDFRRRDATRHHASVLLHELTRGRLERLTTWFERPDDWDEGWVKAALDSDSRLRLSRTELEQLSERLLDVLMEYVELDGSREEPPEDAALVDVQLYGFPVRLLEGDEPGSR